MSPVCAKFSARVAISLFWGGEGGCDAGLGAHGLSGGSDSMLGVIGAVLMCGDGNALGGKLRRLVKLCPAGVSASRVSGPSKSSIVMCRLWPGGLSQPKLAMKSQAKPGFWHGFPKPVALALILESREPWLQATAC
jgi:hypothetical protein